MVDKIIKLQNDIIWLFLMKKWKNNFRITRMKSHWNNGRNVKEYRTVIGGSGKRIWNNPNIQALELWFEHAQKYR